MQIRRTVFFRFVIFVFLFIAAVFGRAATPAPDAIVLVAGDLHSAYDRTAQFLAHVDRLRTENLGVPVAVLINGDTFELGNAVAKRSAGTVEFALFTALAARVPTVVNLGNHEPEFHAVAETVAKIQATGVIVLAGNVLNPSNRQPYAPATTRLKLGAREAVVVGLTTDRLATFRLAVRPELDLADPVVWAQQHLPALLRDATVPVVLAHTGLKADRAILPLVPDGTLFAGAHDHLRFVHCEGRTVYVHSGSWTEFISIARLRMTARGSTWDVEQQRIAPDDPADKTLAALIRATLEQNLTTEETAVVGRTTRALGPTEAARFAVEAARRAAGADCALVGATTFGAGLPAGEVSRFALDACVRFDGSLFTAEVDGAWLQQLLARCNQGPATPWADRAGENLVAAAPAEIIPDRRYRFVTTDWAVKNAKNYFGDEVPVFTEQPALKLKAAVILALSPQP
ncbi:MAG: serine/threonine protein phosphatase [Opitutia bacterium]|nr:MAG: serine/threonine protein phosphatase [Opitutae bacterium]PHX70907.1 MAG: serine/threonine protein phosphatase [Opitutae bacterium]